MKYDIDALRETLGPPGQRNTVDGIAWWHGAGRLTVCLSNDPNKQESVLFRHLPEDTDVQAIIGTMGQRVKGLVSSKEKPVNPS